MNKNHQSKSSAILQQRADILAKPKVDIALDTGNLILTFYVGEEKYAVPTMDVMKVIPSEKVTPFPFMPPIFAGIIYHSGILWPVLNAKNFFQQESTQESSTLILLLYENKNLALLVNNIIGQYTYQGVEELNKITTQQAAQQKVIHGIYHNDIALINTDSLYEVVFVEKGKGFATSSAL